LRLGSWVSGGQEVLLLMRNAAFLVVRRLREAIVKKIIALAGVAVVAAGFLGFSSPGHRVLSTLGFATADNGCSGSSC